VKKLVWIVAALICILVVPYGAWVAFHRNDPVSAKKGRPAEQRLSEAENDPIALLRVLDAAHNTLRANPTSPVSLYNRALAEEKLGLIADARNSWNETVKHDRSAEAIRRRDALPGDPSDRWDPEKLGEAVRTRNRTLLEKMAGSFPAEAERYFEKTDLRDLEGLRLLADVLLAHGDAYASDVIDAAQRTRGRKSPGSPLHLAALYAQAADRYTTNRDALPVLDTIPTDPRYRDLSCRVHTLYALALEARGSYLEARDSYERARDVAKGEPTATAGILARRSANRAVMGEAEGAFLDSFEALKLLPRVADLNTRHHAYGTAATAAGALGYPRIALQYRNAAVAATARAVVAASADRMKEAKHQLSIALRARADTLVALEHDDEAENDLEEASRLAEAINKPELRDLLKMRVSEVRGQALLKRQPAQAVARFTEAIELAAHQDSSYRAVLYFKRAAARRNAGMANADDDIAQAFRILHEEATHLLDNSRRGAYESLWSPYFSRFQDMYQDMIVRRIEDGDKEGAFLYAEQARAFEPMYLLLQSRSVPPGFRKIETASDLQRVLTELPEDTAILQYVVLSERTFTFILTRDRVDWLAQRAGADDIAEWVKEVNDALISKQPRSFTQPMRAAYDGLFGVPLAMAAVKNRKRIVIVADGPMYGLPFAGLQGTEAEGYLIDRHMLATAGSTSLYLYALARDGQFPANEKPHALIVGNPPSPLPSLPNAEAEAIQLADDYPGSELLLGANATIDRFLASARHAYIVHFAGHAASSPRNSMLLLAPHGRDTGELTAERLMTELSELQRTRLVVLAACSTAGGEPVGPEGLAPLVRPIIAANVPAVVGTLWNVKDATAKDLMLSLHCHYRNGDDVAVALQKAQRAMLRKQVPAMYWAPFQVVGYAASPYARPIAMEKTSNDDLCAQDSLHRPDGLHPQ
jgi:CHAT domain-containing protein